MPSATKPATFEDSLRQQYQELVAKKEEIIAKSRPLREAFDAKSREIDEKRDAELRPIEKKMKAAEQGLFEVSNDIAALARALKGRTG